MKRITYTPTLVLLALLSLLSGCAPSVYQLRPVSGDVITLDGRPVTKAEKDGIVVVASYEKQDMDYVVLDVEVKNKTDEPIEVNPADFSVYALGSHQDTLTRPNTSRPYIRSAADPTYEADMVARNQLREEKRLKRAKVINTVLMVAVVASDVASTTSRRNQTYDRWVTNRTSHNAAYQAIQLKRMIDYGSFADKMQRYDYEAYRWKQLALKATTVPAGESVRGFVYLPKTQEAAYLLLNYPTPADGEKLSLLFEQRQEKVTPQRRRR
ncbi:hypothetical protein GCM10023189_46110 [Nibrella saemangeumensis]|uniref:DUF4352 domain-containing protein n=1 Tax=Nibrella saemangeumensis TaxID=1084526 RepID=A0ABP8NH75_9BACT